MAKPVNLDSLHARLKLPVATASNPHPVFERGKFGFSLGYRKTATGGTWIARRHAGDGRYSFKALGIANDHATADGTNVLSYTQAFEKAQAWAKLQTDIKSGVAEPQLPKFEPYTVAQAMEDYIVWKQREKRKKLPLTRLSINAHILPTLGRIDLSELKRSKLEAWKNAVADAAPRVRSKPGKPQAFRKVDLSDESVVRARQATANRILTTLKAALNHALDREKLATNAAWKPVKPFRNVDVPKIRFLQLSEATALVNACSADFKPLVKAAILTGCRYGELKAMKVAAFDRQNSSLFISRSKNGEARHVLLNAEAVAFFHQHTHGKNASDHIFTRANGSPWADSEQKRPMDAACEVAKLEKVTFHILRHTYASQLAMNGAPMKLIADQLGHKSTRITERHYAHLGDTYKRETIERSLPSFGFTAA